MIEPEISATANWIGCGGFVLSELTSRFVAAARTCRSVVVVVVVVVVVAVVAVVAGCC